jgi:hypothetical protein
MKKFNIRILIFLFSLSFIYSCDKEYYDTKDAGEDFLAANYKKGYTTLYDTVTTVNGTDTVKSVDTIPNVAITRLPSGIQYAPYYDDLNGIYPQFKNPYNLIIKVKYAMSFIDGSVYKAYNSDAVLINLSATTASFWQIIIPKMRIGSKWRIWVPYNYAFGSSGYNKHSNGSYDIDPYTVLIYDIELVDAY